MTYFWLFYKKKMKKTWMNEYDHKTQIQTIGLILWKNGMNCLAYYDWSEWVFVAVGKDNWSAENRKMSIAEQYNIINKIV
jgi:hypothetical protein